MSLVQPTIVILGRLPSLPYRSTRVTISLLINVRKLVALDLVFHGPRFVLTEFAGAIVLASALAALSLRSALWGPGHPVVWEFGLGVLLASIGVNYVPLLIHAVDLIRAGTAREEVALELQQAPQSQRRYGTQQFLLAVPFAMLAIAIAQAVASGPPKSSAAETPVRPTGR